MASKGKLNVQTFPRPPLVERCRKHIQIIWNGKLVADSREAYWVLETHHPPTYYLPPSSVLVPLTRTPRSSWCEWKGAATYYSATLDGPSSVTVPDRIWSYEEPTERFRDIKHHLSFYAGPWDCFVDGERVASQPGDFYGGWVTSDVEGIVKGKNGNLDPEV